MMLREHQSIGSLCRNGQETAKAASSIAWILTRLTFALTLFSAAFFKLQVDADAAIGDAHIIWRVLPAYEVGLGVFACLSQGMQMWWAGISTLIAFSSYSIFSLALGVDCGCFGSDSPVGLSLVIDILLLVLFVGLSRVALRIRDEHAALKIALSCSIGFPFIFWSAPDGRSAGSERLGRPVWSVNSLLGRNWRNLLPAEIDERVQLDNECTLYLLDDRCSRCQRVLGSLRKITLTSPQSIWIVRMQQDRSWRMVEMRGQSGASTVIHWDIAAEPYFLAPLRISLKDGKVASVIVGEEVEAEIRDQLSTLAGSEH